MFRIPDSGLWFARLHSMKTKSLRHLFTVISIFIITQSAFAAPKVLVLGAGIGGMTAAQELAERGYDVTVVESGAVTGGKARSMDFENTGVGGRKNLSGEHGFRVFPSFYLHFYDTLSRIPGPDGKPDIEQLYLPEVAWMQRDGKREPVAISTSGEYQTGLKQFLHIAEGISNWKGSDLRAGEALFFAKKMLYMLTSSPERRMKELEFISWWDYLEADTKSDSYQKLFALGTARTLLAMKPTVASARVVGEMFIQFWISGSAKTGGGIDKMLSGASNDALFNPWQKYLESLKANFKFSTEVLRFNMKNGEIDSVTVRDSTGSKDLTADYYVSAMPVDVMKKLTSPEMINAAPDLSKLSKLYVDTMIGLQLYLKAELDLPTSHAFLLDSPWAVAVVYNQTKVWQNYSLSKVGDGTTKSVVSLTFGDVDKPGILFGKPLSKCTEEEIVQEAVAQIDQHLGRKNAGFIAKNLQRYHFDPSAQFDKDGTHSSTPLFINSVGSHFDRPVAQTQIPNFILSSDYVLGNFEISSTMEAANEAGRRAAIAVLQNSGWHGKLPQTFKL